MTFASPLFLIALLLVPALLALAVVVDRRSARYPIAFTNLDVLASVVEPRRAWRRWIALGLLLLALASAATALARPRADVSVPEDNATIVMLVDVSGSMRADDVEPTRLDAAIAAMNAFLDKVPRRFKVGLVQFSSESEVLVPPTTDRQSVRDAIGYLQPDAGTAIGDGLATAVTLTVNTLAAAGTHREPAQRLPAAIVLLSDGAQNRGRLQPLQAAARAKAAGIPVYPVSLGTPDGVVSFGFGLFVNTIPVPPDPATMHAIARATGGRDFTAQSADRARDVFGGLGSSIGRRTTSREISSWFAGAAAALLIAAAGLSRLRREVAP
jgi:Ca-activated chloride channel family protein